MSKSDQFQWTSHCGVWFGLISYMYVTVYISLLLTQIIPRSLTIFLYLRRVLKWGYRNKATSCFGCCSSVVNTSLTSSIPHWMQKGMCTCVHLVVCAHTAEMTLMDDRWNRWVFLHAEGSFLQLSQFFSCWTHITCKNVQKFSRWTFRAKNFPLK